MKSFSPEERSKDFAKDMQSQKIYVLRKGERDEVEKSKAWKNLSKKDQKLTSLSCLREVRTLRIGFASQFATIAEGLLLQKRCESVR